MPASAWLGVSRWLRKSPLPPVVEEVALLPVVEEVALPAAGAGLRA